MGELSGELRRKRFARRIQVRFWNQGETHPRAAYSTNISATGMFVSTATPLPTGSRVRVEILSDDKSCMVEGVVMHSARVAPALRRLKESGMGVRFLSVDELIAELIPELTAEVMVPPGMRPPPPAPTAPLTPPPAPPPARPAADGRRPVEVSSPRAQPSEVRERRGDDKPAPRIGPRGPATGAGPALLGSDHGVRAVLELASLDELRAAFERDLRRGGAFIECSEPAQLHQRLTVAITLPAPLDRGLEFPARVVHATPTGVGVEFTDPDRVIREIEALLSKWE
jgi:Tfp pilus assembly protein PilZ